MSLKDRSSTTLLIVCTYRSKFLSKKVPKPFIIGKTIVINYAILLFRHTHTHTISSFLVINRREDIDRRKHDLAIVAKIQLGFMKHHRQSGITELEENSKWI